MTRPDPIRLAHDDRADLADFLRGLPAEQWDAPTLCDRWSVRDVVAHVISYDDLGSAGFVRRLAAGRFDPDKANQVGVDQYASLSPDELLAELEGHLRPAGLTARLGGRIGLVDGLIHHQDIRRALGAPREVPPGAARRDPALRQGRAADPGVLAGPRPAPGRHRHRLVERPRARRRGSGRAAADGDSRAGPGPGRTRRAGPAHAGRPYRGLAGTQLQPRPSAGQGRWVRRCLARLERSASPARPRGRSD